MNKLISIGELLIDFTGKETGGIKSVSGFEKNPGGAPANVAVCVARLNGKAKFITKLGFDSFGDFLIDVLNENGVDVSEIKRTDKANTPLAFVTLDENGQRDFAFYRNPSSDLFLDRADINKNIFENGDILHFCSVDLVDYPVRDAHKAAISYALENNMLVSFDPNLRFPLWKSKDELIATVLAFIPYCHILKLSDEELTVISKIENEEQAVNSLFVGNVEIILITKGANGAAVYFKNGKSINQDGYRFDSVDTTGAGDTFIGTFIYQLLCDNKTPDNLTGNKERFTSYLRHAVYASGLSVTKRGAIPSMPFYNEVFNVEQ